MHYEDCYNDNCASVGKFTVRDGNGVTQFATVVCDNHLPAAVRKAWKASYRSPVVEKVEKVDF